MVFLKDVKCYVWKKLIDYEIYVEDSERKGIYEGVLKNCSCWEFIDAWDC